MDYSTSASTTYGDAGLAAGFMAFLVAYMVIILIILIPVLIGMWKIFEKAGKPGWAALVPFYSFYVLLQVVGRPSWWMIVLVAPIIPFVGSLAGLVIGVIISIDLAKSFGKDTGFGILLAFLPFIGYPMLGFGKDKYIGPSVQQKPTAPTAV